MGIASENNPDPNEIISASVVDLPVAVCLRLAHDKGQKLLGPSRHMNIPLLLLVSSWEELISVSVAAQNERLVWVGNWQKSFDPYK